MSRSVDTQLAGCASLIRNRPGHSYALTMAPDVTAPPLRERDRSLGGQPGRPGVSRVARPWTGSRYSHNPA